MSELKKFRPLRMRERFARGGRKHDWCILLKTRIMAN